MPSYSGVWTLTAQLQAKGAGNWPPFLSGDIGLFIGGGTASGYRNIIDYITITSTGNAIDFGDISQTLGNLAACASTTRALSGGGTATGSIFSYTNVIDYVTIASVGNATDFGDLTAGRFSLSSCNSSTRGLFAGGNAAFDTFNIIDYVTIATTGDATDFGDLTVARSSVSACSSSTRGVFAGGYVGGELNVIDYVTIASAGNATDFGDLLDVNYYVGACSSSTRGVFAGGISNVIQYVTIASTGNATDFGDLSASTSGSAGCSNSTRGVLVVVTQQITPTQSNTLRLPARATQQVLVI